MLFPPRVSFPNALDAADADGVVTRVPHSSTVVVLKTETVQRPFEKKVKNLPMEADRLQLIAHHTFAPSNRPCLFTRPMRVQIVLGARLYHAWFANGRWPSRFEPQGCAVDGTADSPELWRSATSASMCE